MSFKAVAFVLILVLAGSAPAADYWVVVRTGDKEGAGSDAVVHIKIVGAKGETKWFELDNEGDDREQGSIDIYHLKGDDIGDVKKVVVRAREEKDPKSPRWLLASVTVNAGDIPAELQKSLDAKKNLKPAERKKVDEALRKLPKTVVFEYNRWVDPGKFADRGKAKEWTEVEISR